MEEKSLANAIMVMEERKKSAGFHKTNGIVDDQQVRLIWSDLDLDIEEIDETVSAIIPQVMYHSVMCMSQGVPAGKYFQGLWTDAFTIGVLFERLRNGQG